MSGSMPRLRGWLGRENPTVDRWLMRALVLLGGFLLGISVASDGSGEIRVGLAALGFALFFGGSSVLTSLRRDVRAEAIAARLETKLDEVIELERGQLNELRTMRERGDDSAAARLRSSPPSTPS